jgi:hypothetical protein
MNAWGMAVLYYYMDITMQSWLVLYRKQGSRHAMLVDVKMLE